MEATAQLSATDVSQLKEGDIISYTQYLRFTGIFDINGRLNLIDTFGDKIGISPSIIEKGAYNGTQFDSEEKMTRTELIGILDKVGDTVFTAHFIKQNGEERQITARMINVENGFGRSNVIDLEIALNDPKANAVRQIDHRTLNWIILKGVKYSVK